MIRLSRSVLCLDWDKRSLRFVVAQVSPGSMKLEDAHSRRIPHHVDTDTPEGMGAFIAETLERHGVRVKRAIVDVPRDRAVINRLTVPPTPLNELAAAVRFQATRELPFPLDEAQIDYVVSKRDDSGRATQALLAAVRLDTLDRLRETCKAAGLTPVRIGLRPYANLISATRLPSTLEQRVLFIDVGPTMTEINVFHGRQLAFSRAANVSVPFYSGELVTDDSRVSSKAELSELELSAAVQSGAVEELIVEIQRTLQAFRASETNAPIDQILIGGGTGVEQALLNAADERFGLPAALFDPTVVLNVPESDAEKLRAFSAALGLAWGLSREDLLEIDFLNPKRPIPRGQSLRRRLQVGGAAAGVLLLSGVSWAAVDFVQLRNEVNRLREDNNRKETTARGLREIDVKSMEVADWETEARAVVWLDQLLDFTEKAVAPGKEMLVTAVSCSANSAKVTLKLSCSNWEVADQFVKNLNSLEVDGEPIYRAEQGAWMETKTVDPRFKGRVDVSVRLLALEKFNAGANERRKERDKLIKGT